MTGFLSLVIFGSVVANLFQKVSKKKEARANERAQDLRKLIELLAENRLGARNNVDADHYAQLLEMEGISEADLERNVANYVSRIKWAEIAAQLEERSMALEAAEKEIQRLDVDEGQRRRQSTALA